MRSFSVALVGPLPIKSISLLLAACTTIFLEQLTPCAEFLPGAGGDYHNVQHFLEAEGPDMVDLMTMFFWCTIAVWSVKVCSMHMTFGLHKVSRMFRSLMDVMLATVAWIVLSTTWMNG